MRGGRLTQTVRGAAIIPEGAKAMFGKGNSGSMAGIKHSVNHYNFFLDNKKPYSDVKAHMIQKALGDHTMKNVLHRSDILDGDAKKIIFDTKKYKTFNEQHAALQKAKKPRAAKIFREAILGKQLKLKFNESGIIGEAKRLAGNAGQVLDTPTVYGLGSAQPVKYVKQVGKYLKRGGLVAGTAILGIPLARNRFKKQAARKTKKRMAAERSGQGLLAVGGAGAIIGGAKQVYKPGKNIAVTYGTMPAIGMGHSSPGKAMVDILRKETEGKKGRLKGYKVDTLVRNSDSVYKYTPKKYNLLVDTGLGGEAPDWPDPVRHTHGGGPNAPAMVPHKIHADNKIRYLTDAVRKKDGWFGANIFPGKVMGYGPNLKRVRREAGLKTVSMSKGLSPILDPRAVKEVRDYKGTSADVIDQLVSHETSISGGKTTKRNIGRLKGMRNKKIITISGAGRGDYVATRALEVSNALKKSGLDKDYGVVALMAKAKGTPEEALLKGNNNVARLGLLPRDLFNKAQSTSAVN